MSDQQQMPPQQQGPPQMPPPIAPGPSLDEVLAELLRATKAAAQKSSGATDPREVREFGQGALAFAQAFVQLHPDLMSPQGVTPDMVASSVPQPPAPTQPAQGQDQAAQG
jgi:hypothetical protein